jgi:hypothetical protein
MNKEADPQREVNQTLKGIQHQKEQNAKAAVGQLVEDRGPQNTIQMSEESQATKGVHKLKAFMDNRLSKSQEKGVHQPNKIAQEVGLGNGHSTAGMMAVHAKNNRTASAKESNIQDAKKLHHEKLAELKAMPKPNLTKANKFETKSGLKGQKDALKMVRASNNHSDMNPPVRTGGPTPDGKSPHKRVFEHSLAGVQVRRGDTAGAKTTHQNKLKQLKEEPKPNLTKAEKKTKESIQQNTYNHLVNNRKQNHKTMTSWPKWELEDYHKRVSTAPQTEQYKNEPNFKKIIDEHISQSSKALANHPENEKIKKSSDLTKAGLQDDKNADYARNDEYLPMLDHKQKKNHKEIKRRLEVLRSGTNPQSRADHSVLERLSTLEHPSDRHMIQEAQWHLNKSENGK